MAVGPKSWRIMSCRFVLPPDMGMTLAPSFSAPRYELRPCFDVPVGIAHHCGPSRGSRRGVEPHDAAHGNGEKTEGVIIPKILFGGEGKALQITDRPNVVRRRPGGIESTLVEAHGVIHPLHHLLKPLELQGFQGFPGQGFKFLIIDHGTILSCFIVYDYIAKDAPPGKGESFRPQDDHEKIGIKFASRSDNGNVSLKA